MMYIMSSKTSTHMDFSGYEKTHPNCDNKNKKVLYIYIYTYIYIYIHIERERCIYATADGRLAGLRRVRRLLGGPRGI